MKSILDTTTWRYNPVWSLLDPLESPLWNDSRLSAKSKGVWGYMKSKPHDWDFSAERMAKDFTDGRKTMLNAIKELEATGYLSKLKLKTGRVYYSLSDDPWIGIEPEIKKSPIAKYHVILDEPSTSIGGTIGDAVDALMLAYGAYSITKQEAIEAIDGRTFSSYEDIIEWMDSDKGSIDESLNLPLVSSF